MKKILCCVFSLQLLATHAQKTLQEKLGYSKDSKLLILHADDLGMSHSENSATIYGMEHGSINSASIMVPTPWFPEIAAYARAHPMADLGLHLTLTSEWNYLKWGPVASKSEVPGLVNNNGFLFSAVDSVHRSATTLNRCSNSSARWKKNCARKLKRRHNSASISRTWIRIWGPSLPSPNS